MRRWIAAIGAALVLSACGAQDDGVLRQITPGQTVYIEGWDSFASSGDEAQVEQKPSGAWVIPMEAPYRFVQSDVFKVRVELTLEGQFIVRDMGGVKVGRDHDNCLAAGEAYAKMDVPSDKLQWEDNKGGKPDGDCDRHPEE